MAKQKEAIDPAKAIKLVRQQLERCVDHTCRVISLLDSALAEIRAFRGDSDTECDTFHLSKDLVDRVDRLERSADRIASSNNNFNAED